MGFEHRSVLLKETIDGLHIKPDGMYVDGTLGGGGHSYEICRRLGDKGSIIGIDQDAAAVEAAGVSSYQLDTAERGFSYRVDAPLDMRMDTRGKITARDIVNDYDEEELYRVIRDYGEDKFARNIVRHIVTERGKRPIETTGQLTEIVRRAIPMKYQKMSGHPAKRTFQAIRIELNRELEVLRDSLDEMINLSFTGGPNCKECV